MTGPNQTNLHHSTLKAEPADRSSVIHDLGKLRQELRAAKAMDSPNREDIVRRRIDRKLEALYQCIDPAGVASEAEWGKAG